METKQIIKLDDSLDYLTQGGSLIPSNFVNRFFKKGSLINCGRYYYYLKGVLWYLIPNLKTFIVRESIAILGKKGRKAIASNYIKEELCDCVVKMVPHQYPTDKNPVLNLYPKDCTLHIGDYTYHCPSKKWLPITPDMHILYNDSFSRFNKSAIPFEEFLSVFSIKGRSKDALQVYFASLLLSDTTIRPTLILSGEGNDGKYFVKKCIKILFPNSPKILDSVVSTKYIEGLSDAPEGSAKRVIVVEVPDLSGSFGAFEAVSNVNKDSIFDWAFAGLAKLYPNGVFDWGVYTESQVSTLVLQFFKDTNIERTASYTDIIPFKDLYAEFIAWKGGVGQRLLRNYGDFSKHLTMLGHYTYRSPRDKTTYKTKLRRKPR